MVTLDSQYSMAKEDGFPGEQSLHGNQQHKQPGSENSACLPSNPTLTAPFTCCSIPVPRTQQGHPPVHRTFITDIKLLTPHSHSGAKSLLHRHSLTSFPFLEAFVLSYCFSAWWMQPVLLIAFLTHKKKRAEERFRFPSSFEMWWSWAWSQLLWNTPPNSFSVFPW